MAATAAEPGERNFHTFINYRVRTDATLAEKLSDKLSLHLVPREANLRQVKFNRRKKLKRKIEKLEKELRNLLWQHL